MRRDPSRVTRARLAEIVNETEYVLSLTDEEVRSELIEHSIDPDAALQRMRRRFQEELEPLRAEAARRRLAEGAAKRTLFEGVKARLKEQLDQYRVAGDARNFLQQDRLPSFTREFTVAFNRANDLSAADRESINQDLRLLAELERELADDPEVVAVDDALVDPAEGQVSAEGKDPGDDTGRGSVRDLT